MEKRQTALVVVDMQNDFTNEGAPLEVPSAREGLPRLRAFVDECRRNGLPVIFTRHAFTPEENPVEALLFPSLPGGALEPRTRGWEIDEALAPKEGEAVIDKKRYDAFYGTDLDERLREAGVTSLIVTGTMTEVCCESTARSAMCRDYLVTMVSDLNFTRDPGKHEYALKTFASNFGWVTTAEEALAALS